MPHTGRKTEEKFGESPSCSRKLDETPIIVKSTQTFAMWTTDVIVGFCVICRSSIMEPCIKCQAQGATEKCIMAWGMCNHVFHYHCVAGWRAGRDVCPLDCTPWVYLKGEMTTVEKKNM